MSRASNPDVLIVGAGPVGLACALDLAQAGIKIRIIDKNPARSINSKALGVHAGTLELLSEVFGEELPNEMIAAGRPASQAFFHFDGRPSVRLGLDKIPSRFNYILILEQSETERIFESWLNSFDCQVERNAELVSLEGRETPVCKVKNQNGELEEIKPRYLVGCDGAHSAVRHQLGMSFDGGAYEGSFLLADVRLEWPWDYESVRIFVSRGGVLATFPFKGDARYRLIFVRSDHDFTGDVDASRLLLAAQAAGSGMAGISKIEWLTKFRVHHRIVSRFQNGPVFLAGDAAHIHSPAGGQGMNIGIHDALSVGARLQAALEDGRYEPLQDYSDIRKPIAKSIIQKTDLPFRLALNDGFFIRSARKYLAPHLLGANWFQKRLVREISEVDLARQLIEFRKNFA